jgi:peptidoglycan LD-endopeptidase LytH
LAVQQSHRTGRPGLLAILLFPFLLVLPTGCGQVETVREFFLQDPSPHQEYLMGLWEAGLASSALGQDWILAAGEALANPVAVEAPYQEAGFFPPEEAASRGYRLPLRRGQRLVLTVTLENPSPARVFVDLFRAGSDTLQAPTAVLSGEAGMEIVYEPRRSADYLLRVQPSSSGAVVSWSPSRAGRPWTELLRGGRFVVTIESEPALDFPVADRTTRSIGSRFGDSRDGGRREHHGVDIFAPRGTPVLAAAEAYVSRVDTTPVGGRVIWLRDSIRGASIYYAHLEEPLVTQGARVMPGDTIGLLGNTGNAITTPPHLHFGLYVRGEGPVDPWDFLYRSPGRNGKVEVELGGPWGVGAGGPGRNPPPGASFTPGRGPGPVELSVPRNGHLGSGWPRNPPPGASHGPGSGTQRWYRVRLPDGRDGYLSSRLTERTDPPVRVEADQ